MGSSASGIPDQDSSQQQDEEGNQRSVKYHRRQIKVRSGINREKNMLLLRAASSEDVCYEEFEPWA